MSFAKQGVCPTRRRPPAGDLVTGPLYLDPYADSMMLWGTTRALDLVDQALDASLAAIRARGLDPDPDPEPSKYDDDPAQEEWEDVDPYP